MDDYLQQVKYLVPPKQSNYQRQISQLCGLSLHHAELLYYYYIDPHLKKYNWFSLLQD